MMKYVKNFTVVMNGKIRPGPKPVKAGPGGLYRMIALLYNHVTACIAGHSGGNIVFKQFGANTEVTTRFYSKSNDTYKDFKL